jgi:putative membrane protein
MGEMKELDKGRGALRYLVVVTAISVILIIVNVLLGMRIPFSVNFLVGYVGALLVYVVWHAVLTKGWKNSLLMLGLSFSVAFLAEALGVNFGLVFGKYHYSPALGVSLFGVPFLAALAWEPIVYAAFCISDLLSAGWAESKNKPITIVLMVWLAMISALATTAWDLMIDPIAVSQGWWVWEEGGAYMPYVANGVPITNFMGWLGVAFLINLIYRKISAGIPTRNRSISLSLYGPLMLYLSLFLTSFGVALSILKRPEAGLIGMLAMGPFLLVAGTNLPAFVHHLRNSSTPATDNPS